MARFPKVAVTVMQGSAAQCRAAVHDGAADLLLADEPEEGSDLLMLPSFQWQRGLVLPKEHPLAKATSLTPAELVEFALVTDGRALSTAHGTDCAHAESRIACCASDSDVLKTYVRQGMGNRGDGNFCLGAPARWRSGAQNGALATRLCGRYRVAQRGIFMRLSVRSD